MQAKPKKRRLWISLLRGTLLAVACLLVCLIVAGVLLVRHPTSVANWLLNRQQSPYSIKIDKITTLASDRVAVTGLQIKSRHNDELALQINSADVGFDLGGLRKEGLQGVRSLEIQGGRISVSPPDLPRIELDLDVTAGPETHEAVIRNLTTTGDDRVQAKIAEMTVHFTPEGLHERRIQSIHLDKPSLDLDLDFFTSRAGPPTAPEKQPTPPWDPGRVQITKGQIKLRGKNLPPVETHLNLVPLPDTAESQLLLSQLRVGDAASPVMIAEHLAITASPDARESRRVTKFELSGARVTITAATLDLVKQFFPDRTSPAPADTTGAPAPQPWSVGSVHIHDTTVTGTGLGEKIPEFSFAFEIASEDVTAETPLDLHLRDLRLATPFQPKKAFLSVENITVTASANGVQNQSVDSVTIDGAHVAYDRYFRSWMNPASNTEPPAEPAIATAARPDWKLGALDLTNSRVSIEDLGFGIPGIDFALRTRLTDLASGGLQESAEKIETVELTDLTIHSPLDPFAPVLNLQSIFIRFSAAGLLRRELEEIVVLHPVIFIGEDLFWYADELKKRTTAEEKARDPAQETPNWTLNRFEASYGRLIIASGGASRVALPLNFSTQAKNINFQSINDLQLKLNLVVPKEDYAFPSYQLELSDLYGNIEFGLPPASGANNINNTLYSAITRWRQFLSTEVWLSVTYDLDGVNGNFGGSAYGGYVNGGFSFFIRDAVPWIGWVAATGMDLKSLTDVVAPENFQMSGPADLKIEVNATGPKIERVIGTLKATAPGSMNITRLDNIIESLPEEWTSLKRDISRIGLEVLKDFAYEEGGADFWFLGDQGRLDLDLTGSMGSRRFSVVLHGDNPNQNRSQNLLWQTTQTDSSSH